MHKVEYFNGWGWSKNEKFFLVSIETIPDGTLNQLCEHWKSTFDDNPLPIDTALVEGAKQIKQMAVVNHRHKTGEDLKWTVMMDFMKEVGRSPKLYTVPKK